MNAPPFPLNPQVGEWSQNWVWNGAQWVASPTTGLRIVTQTFTQSGPYMPSPGLVSCVVECIGGGGGGGSVEVDNLPSPGSYAVTGGGGGSGGYSRKTLPAALVRGGVLVTVGAGGPNSGPGEATTFGALCLANGGEAGQKNDVGGSGNWGYGGPGASPGVGDVTFPGASGEVGQVQYFPTQIFCAFAGAMGGHIFGDTIGAMATTNAWDSGKGGQPNSGAGGSGAVFNQTPGGTAGPGGDGGSGICIVTEYVWGDRDQPQPPQWRPPLDVNVSFPRPPWPGGQPMPPGAPWWPWWPWPPGQPPRPPLPGPREFEAEQQSFQPWDDPNASDS